MQQNAAVLALNTAVVVEVIILLLGFWSNSGETGARALNFHVAGMSSHHGVALQRQTHLPAKSIAAQVSRDSPADPQRGFSFG
jgi:hypothetical protein